MAAFLWIKLMLSFVVGKFAFPGRTQNLAILAEISGNIGFISLIVFE